jgi:hypothetical protein
MEVALNEQVNKGFSIEKGIKVMNYVQFFFRT